MPSSIRRSLYRALGCAGVLLLGSCADQPAPLSVDGAQPAGAMAPAGSQVQVSAGDGQVALAGDTLPSMNVVRVVDQSGAPVKGVTVQWTVTSGGGTIVVAGGYTNATGRAYARWKLGAVVGFQTMRVDADGAGSVTFEARAIPTSSQLQVHSGNGQSAPAGSLLPELLGARLVDATGNPVPGAQVMWTVVSGGGTLHHGVASVTDAEGVAVQRWQLGSVPGEQRVRATFRGLPPVEFTATALSDGVQLLISAGNNQTGTPPDTLTSNLVVRLLRADGSYVEGATVSWAVTSGGGGLRYARTVTNSTGRAYNAWALGPALGTQQVTATVAGVGTVTFNATAVANGRTLTVLSGSGQSGYPGDTLPSPLVMRVTDGAGRPIHGVKVTWRVQGGGGGLRTLITYTDADGRAENRWTLGAIEGQQEVRAAVTGSGEVAFTATGLDDPASQIAYRSNRLGGGGRIWVIRPDGTGRYALMTPAGAEQPDWSPDGERMVFMRALSSTNYDLRLVNADGTGETPLLTLAGHQRGPAWSPAGDRIAFYGDGPSGAGVYVVNANGTGLTLLRSGAGEPAWSPDGTRIAYVGGAGEPGIWTMAANGSNPVQVVGYGAAPSWSPDGTRIAFQGPNDACACDDGMIEVVAASGGTPVPVTWGSTPDWSPDGQWLAFTYDYILMVIRADGTGQRTLDGGGAINAVAPSWKPMPTP